MYNPRIPVRRSVPAAKAFETHELRRIPVIETPEAHTLIIASSAEGRRLPQALSEVFGGLENAKEVRVDAVPRSTYFASGPEHFHPVTGEEDRMLVVHVVHMDDSIDPHRYIVNVKDLREVHPAGRLGFNALATARELVRLYPHK
jgi:hypothetical protein